MKIDIISGPPASGKTTRLRQIEQAYKDQGKEVLSIHSEFSLSYLRRRIILAALQGYVAIVLDDCSKDKLKKLLRAKKEIEERMDFDLTLHVVEAA
jgi:tRNA uridine 5-carbamoylmethylation protein Kti12